MFANELSDAGHDAEHDAKHAALDTGYGTGARWSPACCDALAFGELVRAVLSAEAIRDARHELIRRCASILDVSLVGLTRQFPDTGLGFVAFTSDVSRLAGQIEQHSGEGPAWQAHASRSVQCVDDLTRDARWPGYAEELSGSTGVRSVLALPLVAGDELLGAVVAYSIERGHFGWAMAHVADLLTAHASAALGSVAIRVKARNLEVALKTNRDIATAVGIVMDRFRITDQEAFGYLREVSQRRHLKLGDLAERVVVTGEIPRLPGTVPATTAR